LKTRLAGCSVFAELPVLSRKKPHRVGYHGYMKTAFGFLVLFVFVIWFEYGWTGGAPAFGILGAGGYFCWRIKRATDREEAEDEYAPYPPIPRRF
jgi:hypothetical protein